MSPAIERFGPAIAFLLTILVFLYFKQDIQSFAVKENLSTAELYSAVFGWSAIQTGFLFAVFGFVIGSQSSFMAEIRGTMPMKQFLGYTKRAVAMGFVLTFLSMPLMVAAPQITTPSTLMYLSITLWFALFIWAFLAFARVAYLFGLMLKPENRDIIPG